VLKISFVAVMAMLALGGCDQNHTAVAAPAPTAPVKAAKVELEDYQKTALVDEIVERLNKTEDDPFKKVSFFSSMPSTPALGESSTHFYLVRPSEEFAKPYLRVYASYIGERWIFFDRIQILAGSEVVLDRTFDRSKSRRDTVYGGVIESADFVVEPGDAVAALKIAQAGAATIRMSGEKQYDRKMTPDEVRNFAKLAEIYDDMEPLFGRPKKDVPRLSGPSDNLWRLASTYYSKRPEAIKRTTEYKKAGFDAYVEKITMSNGEPAWMVMMGEGKKRSEAEIDLAAVKKAGLEAYLRRGEGRKPEPPKPTK
jgi:hypothetical protein